MTGVVILVGAVVLAAAVALWHRTTRGRFAPATRATATAPTALTASPAGGTRSDVAEQDGPEPALDADTWTALGATPGERATLLQFSSAFCAPCRATRVTLADVAARVPGVAHVEVDAEQHLDLVRRLKVMRTPTTLVLDAHGAEATRAAGAPTRDQVLGALSHLSDSEST